MADYKIAIGKVLKTEGGYVIDSGGETWKGVARLFWKDWKGFYYIDQAKKQNEWPKKEYKEWNESDFKIVCKILSAVRELDALIVSFYESNFWNQIEGDNIKNQSIADMLVDSSVNQGIKPAIKRAQSIVNLQQTGIIEDQLIKRLNLLS